MHDADRDCRLHRDPAVDDQSAVGSKPSRRANRLRWQLDVQPVTATACANDAQQHALQVTATKSDFMSNRRNCPKDLGGLKILESGARWTRVIAMICTPKGHWVNGRAAVAHGQIRACSPLLALLRDFSGLTRQLGVAIPGNTNQKK